jgi:hypothetical protein
VIDYSYAIGEEALRVFVALPARQRRPLLRFLDGLTQRPFQPGIYQEPGAANRIYELQLVGNLLVTWWCDHGAKEVRVVRIERIH